MERNELCWCNSGKKYKRCHMAMDEKLSLLESEGHIVTMSIESGNPTNGTVAPENPLLENAARQLDEYFAGTRRAFDLPLDPVGTEFQRSAWAELSKIPFGETISYGEQARRLGDANKSRAVGAANGRNPISIIVPCHRVVGANGALTGFAAGLDVKEWLLQHERGGQLSLV